MSNDSSDQFTHTDSDRGEARMVDVGGKETSDRRAVARGRLYMAEETLDAVRRDAFDKGDVEQIGRIAGIMGSKRTSDLIPLCHPIPVDGTDVIVEPEMNPSRLEVRSEVRTHAKTGVEMEALTAVTTACLTLYDMCKSMDREMVIGEIYLETKQGGSSGEFHHPNEPTPRAIHRGTGEES